MDLPIQLIVKVQQFEDKRIEAKASWNIKELKGKLSEIYPTVSVRESRGFRGKFLETSRKKRGFTKTSPCLSMLEWLCGHRTRKKTSLSREF
jgi:hypothetical protein